MATPEKKFGGRLLRGQFGHAAGTREPACSRKASCYEGDWRSGAHLSKKSLFHCRLLRSPRFAGPVGQATPTKNRALPYLLLRGISTGSAETEFNTR